MAKWKRLTDHEGVSVDINMDNVAYIRRNPEEETTMIALMSATSSIKWLAVKETPDDIHKAEPLGSK
jgi:hypothetical protein